VVEASAGQVTNAAMSSYDPAHFAPLFAAEDRHFWFRARNRIIAMLVRQIVRTWSSGYRVLEVGCGTGNVLRVLDRACRHGHVVGMDLFAEGLHYARRRTTVPLVQGDMHRAPFSVPFDMIGLFDVLEHLPDDRRVLADLHGMLQPGGVLILSVPAHQSLWSYFDEAACHCRRYTLPELESKLREAGFTIEYATEFMSVLFPLVWSGRRIAALLNRNQSGQNAARKNVEMSQQELRIVPVVNELLTAILRQEERLIAQRRRLPCGTSLLAIARKSSSVADGTPKERNASQS
jgi:SAM-dependent methyltransferase